MFGVSEMFSSNLLEKLSQLVWGLMGVIFTCFWRILFSLLPRFAKRIFLGNVNFTVKIWQVNLANITRVFHPITSWRVVLHLLGWLELNSTVITLFRNIYILILRAKSSDSKQLNCFFESKNLELIVQKYS